MCLPCAVHFHLLTELGENGGAQHELAHGTMTANWTILAYHKCAVNLDMPILSFPARAARLEQLHTALSAPGRRTAAQADHLTRIMAYKPARFWQPQTTKLNW